MIVYKTKFKDLLIIKQKNNVDKRGILRETYHNKILKKKFIFEYCTSSKKGVLRGFHLQVKNQQSKYVSVLKGRILDVVVDLRKKSKTFGKHKSFLLSEDNKLQLFIPKGFAHGFIVLSSDAIFSYKVDNLYYPENDSGILWCDKDLNIDWVLEKKDILVSEKDSKLKSLRELK